MNKLTNGQTVFWLIWSDNVLEINLFKNIGLFLMGQLIHYGLSQ
jgi:hypothetical protein